VRVIDLDLLDYNSAWRRQEQVHAEVLAGAEEAILLVEHPPTITYGRRAEESARHLQATPGQLRNLRVEVIPSDRGGDITFHGPGQIVAYPIIRLADHGLSVGAYMKQIQLTVIDALAAFQVAAQLDPAAPGVWCADRSAGRLAKLCAVGVRVKRGITMHGLALNVEPDLSFYKLIVPCGLDRPVTSLHRLLGSRAPSLEAVKAVLVHKLVARFESRASNPPGASAPIDNP
jgi:lipoyl(octanoyl) transferase